MLSGLQPNSLVIIGARPAVGKTSFALGMVGHAALEANRPVLFFSLAYVCTSLELTGALKVAAARVVRASRGRPGTLLAGLLGSSEARGQGCDAFDPALCLLPFPSDRLTVADAATATGRRVSLKREWMPANVGGTKVDPTEWNRNDGFSPGQAGLVRVPGIDLG